MNPRGGTELLYENLKKYTGTDWQEYVNLILSFCYEGIIDTNKINIVWQHLMTDQGAVSGMNRQGFVDSVDKFVYVSNWQLEQYKEKFNISNATNLVIRNAIEPIDYTEKPQDRLRLIYTSMPGRGLDVLLDAFQLIDRDVELIVYSSNIIYGKGYHDMIGNTHDQLFNRAKTMKNVNYKGFAMNKAVRQALTQAHILAYPSIFEETSCLAAIEAGSAGCKIVTTNYGALTETCGKYATYVPYTLNRRALVRSYAEALIETIDNYHPESYNLKAQSEWFNTQYSWHNRKQEWINLLVK